MESQQQIEQEASDSNDEELEDKLFEVATKTGEDDEVECEISGYEEVEDGIRVQGRLPWGEHFEELFDFPERNDPEEYKFVRLCESAGFSLTSVEELTGTAVTAEKEGGEWRFHAPAPETMTQRAEAVFEKSFVFSAGLVTICLLPVVFALGLYFDDDEPGTHFDSYGEMAMNWIIITTMWMVVAGVVGSLVLDVATALVL